MNKLYPLNFIRICLDMFIVGFSDHQITISIIFIYSFCDNHQTSWPYSSLLLRFAYKSFFRGFSRQYSSTNEVHISWVYLFCLCTLLNQYTSFFVENNTNNNLEM